MNNEEKILSYVKRIYESVRPQPCWVSASFIMKVTGWNKHEMEQAREQKIVEYRISKSGSYEYDVNSVPEAFIKNKN